MRASLREPVPKSAVQAVHEPQRAWLFSAIVGIERAPLPKMQQSVLFQIAVGVVFRECDIQLLLVVQHHKALCKGTLGLLNQRLISVVVAVAVYVLALAEKAEENVLLRSEAADVIGEKRGLLFVMLKPQALFFGLRWCIVILSHILCPAEQNPIRGMKTGLEHSGVSGVVIANQKPILQVCGGRCAVFFVVFQEIPVLYQNIRAGFEDIGASGGGQTCLRGDQLAVHVVQRADHRIDHHSTGVFGIYNLIKGEVGQIAVFPGGEDDFSRGKRLADRRQAGGSKFCIYCPLDDDGEVATNEAGSHFNIAPIGYLCKKFTQDIN